jgi:hypothetical protein
MSESFSTTDPGRGANRSFTEPASAKRPASVVVARLRALKDYGARYIDYGMAWKGALFLGLAVWAINLSHGPLAALPAALKQATYTYFVAGFITRLCENLAVAIENRPVALAVAVAVPSCIAIGLTTLLHTLKGTPEPLTSVIPTAVAAPPGFLWYAVVSRRRRPSDGVVCWRPR